VVAFPVIACVSSVGGIDALSRVLHPLPADFPAAVIALQHLDPDQPSQLAEILARRCALPVVTARHHQTLEPGRVFVAPPGRHTLVSSDATLVVVASGAYPPYRPSADLLLTSLALAAGPMAIAVVLSGRGNDGATGATVVHDLGGTVIAADAASSAQYDMPAATIARGDALDYERNVDTIADLLHTVVTRRVGPPRARLSTVVHRASVWP
jgi:two-component system chemotaxis response regulator CheB